MYNWWRHERKPSKRIKDKKTFKLVESLIQLEKDNNNMLIVEAYCKIESQDETIRYLKARVRNLIKDNKFIRKKWVEAE